MCQAMELNGSFTGVDVGRIHLGVVRINCTGERGITVTDWQLINVNDLCARYEQSNNTEKFSVGANKDYPTEAHCHCLFKWVCDNSRGGGLFDSSAVFIEAQSFTREMKALQTAIHMGVIASKPSIVVRRNDPEIDQLQSSNCVSPAVIVSANSVKTCFAAFYPRVTETLTTAKKRNPAKKFKAFGVGDHARGDDERDSKQYAENKKNSVYFGQLLVSVQSIASLIGSRITAEMRETLLQALRDKKFKKDDLYDALWIVLYGIETWLPALYSRRKRGYGAACVMYGGIPQRRYRTCDALFEFARGVGTPESSVQELRDTLAAYRNSAANDEEFDEEDVVDAVVDEVAD